MRTSPKVKHFPPVLAQMVETWAWTWDKFQLATPCWQSPMFAPYSEQMERLHRWSNYDCVEAKQAAEVMRELGFEPFAGFPLQPLQKGGRQC